MDYRWLEEREEEREYERYDERRGEEEEEEEEEDYLPLQHRKKQLSPSRLVTPPLFFSSISSNYINIQYFIYNNFVKNNVHFYCLIPNLADVQYYSLGTGGTTLFQRETYGNVCGSLVRKLMDCSTSAFSNFNKEIQCLRMFNVMYFNNKEQYLYSHRCFSHWKVGIAFYNRITKRTNNISIDCTEFDFEYACNNIVQLRPKFCDWIVHDNIRWTATIPIENRNKRIFLTTFFTKNSSIL